jgi:hypothetical protein
MLFKLVLTALLTSLGAAVASCLKIDGPYGDTAKANTFDDLSWIMSNYQVTLTGTTIKLC